MCVLYARLHAHRLSPPSSLFFVESSLFLFFLRRNLQILFIARFFLKPWTKCASDPGDEEGQFLPRPGEVRGWCPTLLAPIALMDGKKNTGFETFFFCLLAHKQN